MKTDEKLREALVAQLNFWVGRSADSIKMAVKDGVVTLQGSVPSYAEKMECLETVRRTGGVKAVTDEVVVELPGSRKRPDAEIAAAVASAINLLTTVPLDSVNATVRAGKVILEGSIKDAQGKQVVELVVRNTPGVTGITNLIVPDCDADHDLGHELMKRVSAVVVEHLQTGLKTKLLARSKSIGDFP
ncbi:MAG TPA: BON domain-containing protein [Alphaproteobacteria bacterium]|nr:BON domain-containing protein [Alphaproteobacteria bacterium]